MSNLQPVYEAMSEEEQRQLASNRHPLNIYNSHGFVEGQLDTDKESPPEHTKWDKEHAKSR